MNIGQRTNTWSRLVTRLNQQQLVLAKELPDVRPMLYDARGIPLVRGPVLNALGPGSCQWTFHQHLTADDRQAKAPAAAAAQAPAALQEPGPPAQMKLAVPTVTREIAIPFEFGGAAEKKGP
jgi:hypothetical protein